MKFLEKIKNKKVIGYIATLLVGVFLGNLAAPMCATSEHDDIEEKLKKQEQVLIEQEDEIETLNAKIDSAKPWFEKTAEEQRVIEEESERKKAEEEQAKKEAEEQAKKEAEEQAKKEAEEQAKKEAEEQAKKEAQGVDTDDVKQVANSIIMNELRENITNTTLQSIRVNQNLGTDSNKDVVVLADLSWSTKNTEKTTREMLEMYSDHLAANLSADLAEGSEIALFWEAEYTGLDIKHSYYIKNGNAYKQ